MHNVCWGDYALQRKIRHLRCPDCELRQAEEPYWLIKAYSSFNSKMNDFRAVTGWNV